MCLQQCAQEHEGFSASSVTMPTRMTKKGFPTVHQLDFSSLTAAPGSSAQTNTSQLEGRGMAKPPKKKKSLFAQQLEKHGLEYFGIEISKEMAGVGTPVTIFKKDYVEPVTLGGTVSLSGGSPLKYSVEERMEGESAAVGVSGGQDMEVEGSGGVAREEFESGASQAWDRYVVLYYLHTWQIRSIPLSVPLICCMILYNNLLIYLDN